MSKKIDWMREHILFIANEMLDNGEKPDANTAIVNLRSVVEPWLTAVFQSEHLSLLLGSGLTTGICCDCFEDDKTFNPQTMNSIDFITKKNEIKKHAEISAQRLSRGKPNFEDALRTAIELLKGLEILEDSEARNLETEINKHLQALIQKILENEKNFLTHEKGKSALALLKRFLISFSSRTATRDRLHIFTTNYDRFIEYSLDAAGIHTLDRFVGKLNPTLRMHKMELDFHYNPPGIRGEPRYVEGVVRFTKLHGSLDWRSENGEIYKEPLPFGTTVNEDDSSNSYMKKVVYPNSAKGVETIYFPYSELFRDFSTAICRPNSVLVTYGYGFGDSHINSIIHDMLTIPSTHLVIISFDKAGDRIEKFVNKCNLSQLTLMIGKHYGNIRILTENYLPKSAIDRISERCYQIKEKRGSNQSLSNNSEEKNEQ